MKDDVICMLLVVLLLTRCAASYILILYCVHQFICHLSQPTHSRSHLTFHNKTSMKLSFFGFCISWGNDEFIGCAEPGTSICVPIQLASTTHIRLGTPKPNVVQNEFQNLTNDCFLSDRLMILPTGNTSNKIIRTSIVCEHDTLRDTYGFLSIKKLHFLLNIKCENGVCDLYVEPVLRVINLLPCQLLCHLGQIVDCSAVKGRKIVQTEEILVPVGQDAKCLSVDCRLKPHISVRLPGYR